MVNPRTQNRIRKSIQEELVKRLLIKYFKDKGFTESFDKMIFPPMMFDMPYMIPELLNSVEIVPFVEKMDPITNVVTMGWNLFVLGTNRMNLGTSTHPNLMEFRRSLMGQQGQKLPSEMKKTPKAIIEFVMDIVGRNKSAITEFPPNTRLPTVDNMLPSVGPKIGPSMSGGWYEKNRPV